MSYVTVPPAYYYAQQPDTLYRSGARGWWDGPVPGWGENPNSSWAARQAVNGLGADQKVTCTPPTCQPPAPPRFTYRAPYQQDDYIRTSIAPWGNFPHGPAYQSPQESTCPECVGWPVSRTIGGLGSLAQAARDMQRGAFTAAARAAVTGLGCGPCQISPNCQTCPNGSDLPECAGCVDGQPAEVKRSVLEHPLAGPVIVGVATTLAVSVALYLAKRAKAPVG
jgi:hypothetical protein